MKKEEIIRELENRGFAVEEQNVIKNGISRTGIYIRNESNIHPIINLEQIIDDSEKNQKTVSEVADKVINLLRENDNNESLGKLFTDREFVKNHLYIGMQKSSDENLVLVPCSIPNVEAYLMVKFTQKINNSYDAKVTLEYLNALDIDKDDAIKMAFEHTCADTKLVDLMDLLSVPFENRGFMYVLTNTEGHKGAACILNREAVLELSMKTHSRRLICIPSSIHEWIIVPHGDAFSMNELKQIIQLVNNDQVPAEDQLGNEPYVLDVAKYLN